jgi:hypothetical protein
MLFCTAANASELDDSTGLIAGSSNSKYILMEDIELNGH